MAIGENFDYPTPSSGGVYLSLEIIIALVGVGVCLFCCGIGMAFCIVYRYKRKKQEIMK